jgi:hypothetical protein
LIFFLHHLQRERLILTILNKYYYFLAHSIPFAGDGGSGGGSYENRRQSKILTAFSSFKLAYNSKRSDFHLRFFYAYFKAKSEDIDTTKSIRSNLNQRIVYG